MNSQGSRQVRAAGYGAARTAFTDPSSLAGQPGGFLRVRAGTERLYWQWQEYRESAATREASALLVFGPEKHSGAPLRTLYFGSGNHLSYVLGLLYDEYRVEEEHRHLHAWQRGGWVDGYRNKVDFVRCGSALAISPPAGGPRTSRNPGLGGPETGSCRKTGRTCWRNCAVRPGEKTCARSASTACSTGSSATRRRYADSMTRCTCRT